MSSNDDRVRDLITQHASDWFVANRTELAAADRDAFAAWLRASPVHIEEYLAISAIAGELSRTRAGAMDSIETIVARARTETSAAPTPLWPRLTEGLSDAIVGGWQRAAVSIASLGVVSLALLALWNVKLTPPAPVSDTQSFATRHGEQQTQVMVDGSILHLNTDSAVTVQYGKGERLVTLNAGEVDFEVKHDAARPFRVQAGAAEIIDLGTQFDVRREYDSTLVTVAEGRVSVGLSAQVDQARAQDRRALTVDLGTNQQIRVVEKGWPAAPVNVDAQRAIAWLHRQIMFEHEPLGLVATEFNRYTSKPIEIETPALRDLKISGVFATDDTEAFIAFLRSLPGVRVEASPTRIRVLRE